MVQGFHADIDLHGQHVYMSFHMADLTASPQACCAPLLSKLPLLTVRTHKVTLLYSLHHTNGYTYSWCKAHFCKFTTCCCQCMSLNGFPELHCPCEKLA